MQLNARFVLRSRLMAGVDPPPAAASFTRFAYRRGLVRAVSHEHVPRPRLSIGNHRGIARTRRDMREDPGIDDDRILDGLHGRVPVRHGSRCTGTDGMVVRDDDRQLRSSGSARPGSIFQVSMAICFRCHNELVTCGAKSTSSNRRTGHR